MMAGVCGVASNVRRHTPYPNPSSLTPDPPGTTRLKSVAMCSMLCL